MLYALLKGKCFFNSKFPFFANSYSVTFSHFFFKYYVFGCDPDLFQTFTDKLSCTVLILLYDNYNYTLFVTLETFVQLIGTRKLMPILLHKG